MGNLNFNAADVPPPENFDPLPTGWYAMRIVWLEMRTGSKAEAGEMLAGELEILDEEHPSYAGRKAFFNLCINHANEQPRVIARKQLSAICHAVGMIQVADTGELLGQSVRVRLVAVPARDGYDAKNEVKGFKALSEGDEKPAAETTAASKAAATTTTTTAAPKPSSNGKPSWKR